MKSGSSFELPDFLIYHERLRRFVWLDRICLSSLEVHLPHEYFSAIPNLRMITVLFELLF